MKDKTLRLGDLLVIVSILASTGGAVWKIGQVIGKFETRLVELESDKYPMSVASEAALRMAIENPGLKVPDPRDLNRVIVVQQAMVVGTP